VSFIFSHFSAELERLTALEKKDFSVFSAWEQVWDLSVICHLFPLTLVLSSTLLRKMFFSLHGKECSFPL
jgi:hypothetical protein